MDDVHPETAGYFQSQYLFPGRYFVNEKRYHIQELLPFGYPAFLGQNKWGFGKISEHIIKTLNKRYSPVKDYDLHGIVLKPNSGILTGVDVKI